MNGRWMVLWAALVVGCDGGAASVPADTAVDAAGKGDALDGAGGDAALPDAGDAVTDSDVDAVVEDTADATPAADADAGSGPVDAALDTDPEDTAVPEDTTDAGALEDSRDAAPEDAVADVPEDTGSDAAVTDAADVTTDVGPDVEDAGEPDTGPWVPPVDCSAIPEGPFDLVVVPGAMASEDIAFDKLGNVVGSNDKAIFKTAYGELPKVFVPKLDFRAGMRYLPNGHLVVCNNYKGQLDRIDEKGEVHVLLTGLSYPNGITVDMQGWVYFTEHDANQVWRVNPFTGDKTLLTSKIANPNGITFSVDYRTLYIGGFSGVGTVYSMSISKDGVPGKLVPFATGVGTGWLDGMGVDACGNVYIADYGATIIYRISPDGQTKTPIIDGSSQGAYLPNLDWGSGIGGWDTGAIYLPNGWAKGVFEAKIGVPSKPVPYP